MQGGLVAGMFEELGITEVMDKATQQNPAMRLVTTGHAVKAIVLNGLGFVNRSPSPPIFSTMNGYARPCPAGAGMRA
jgi:hypothetical protein